MQLKFRKSMPVTGGFFAVLLTGLTPSSAFAANDKLLVYAPTTESTATNEQSHYGSKLDIISREQIDQAGANADITRVLQMYVPGLYVAPKTGPFDYGYYSLLGGKADDTLIMIDGVRLNNRLYGGIYIDTLPTTAIERIEVLKGAQSLMFGTQAVSGVINIVTKTPQSKHLAGQLNLAIDTFAGTNTDIRIGDVHDNAIGNFSWLAWAGKNRSAGYQPFRDSDLSDLVSQRKRGYDLNLLGTKISQTFGNDARLTLLWQYAQGKFDFATAQNKRKTEQGTEYYGAHEQHNDRVQNIGTLTFDHYLNDQFSYFIKGHLNHWDTHYTDIKNTDINGVRGIRVASNHSYWGFRDYGIQAEGKLNFATNSELLFGLDNQWYSGKDQVLKIKSSSTTASAVYLQLRPQFAALPDWRPALGLRHEKIHNGSGTTVWMFSSAYELTDNLQLRGQIGTAYKLPTAERLYAIEPDDIGNPNLKPEQSRNIEAGFDYITTLAGNNQLKFSASYYNRNIYNMQGQNSDSLWINIPGNVKVQGFEANSSLTLADSWILSADITRNYLNSGYVINNVPYLFSRLRVNYQAASQRWGGQFAMRYVDRIIARNIDYGHYAIFDLSGWLYIDQALHHKISLNIDNVFNRQYASSITRNDRQSIPILGRPLTAELRYSWTF